MFRISLRELLVFVALFALAVASLKYANDAWLAIVAGVTMLAFSIAIITAAVDRGSRQAHAIGFALTFLAYCAAVLTGMTTASGLGNETAIKNIEFDQWDGRLPTTRLLRYIHWAMNATGYYDAATDKLIPDFDPNDVGQPRLAWRDDARRQWYTVRHLPRVAAAGEVHAHRPLLVGAADRVRWQPIRGLCVPSTHA
jgi:hypothetical protein